MGGFPRRYSLFDVGFVSRIFRAGGDRDAALEQSAQAVAMARERYEAGEDDLINLLESESEFRAAEEAALSARAEELTALVTLYKALGGGWQS